MKRPFIQTTEAPPPAEATEASAPETAPERLRELARANPALAPLVGANPKAPPELLHEMATESQWIPMIFNPPYRWRLGTNKWSAPEHYQWHFSNETRRAVAQNPSARAATLLRLAAHFPNEVAENPALSLLTLEEPDSLQKVPLLVLVLLAEDARFQPLVRGALPRLHVAAWLLLAQDDRCPAWVKDELQRLLHERPATPDEQRDAPRTVDAMYPRE